MFCLCGFYGFDLSNICGCGYVCGVICICFCDLI